MFNPGPRSRIVNPEPVYYNNYNSGHDSYYANLLPVEPQNDVLNEKISRSKSHTQFIANDTKEKSKKPTFKKKIIKKLKTFTK